MKKYPALAYEYKDNKGVYIGIDMEDTTNPNEAYLFADIKGTMPDKDKCIRLAKEEEEAHRRHLTETFDKVGVIDYTPYKWLEYADLVHVEIDADTFEELS